MASIYASNIVINSGADFYQTFTLEDTETGSLLDLTGYSVHSQIRKWSGSSNYVSLDANVLPTSGSVSIGLSAPSTLSLNPGRYVYDILVVDPSGKKTRVVEGMVLVREGVTRV